MSSGGSESGTADLDTGATTGLGTDGTGEPLPPDLPSVSSAKNLGECVADLDARGSGWCEMRVDDDTPGISAVWPSDLDPRIRMNTGPAGVLIAWNSASYDRARKRLYFAGGGHADYGGNEVYEFDLGLGRWTRLTDPAPLDHLWVDRSSDADPEQPWRRLCWMPDPEHSPGSSHTYDGVLFHSGTETVFWNVYGAANGSCFEDENGEYDDDPIVAPFRRDVSARWASSGLYEFNPSWTEMRNGLQPLSWRRVLDYDQQVAAGIEGGYMRTAELPDGRIVMGGNHLHVAFDPFDPDPAAFVPFSGQADWGDGTAMYDDVNDLVWMLQQNSLIRRDATGTDLGTLQIPGEVSVDHGKSMAIDSRGHIVSWNGQSRVWVHDPSARTPQWVAVDWGEAGPQVGDNRVYGKWLYLAEQDVFVGLSTHETGVWVYRHDPALERQ